MKRTLIRLLMLLVVVALGLWGWHKLWPDPERAIRARLAELAQLASFGPNEAPAAKLWNAEKVASFFTPDVTIKVDVNGPQANQNGREAIVNAAMWARQNWGAATVQFTDVVITLAPGKQSAIAELSARARAGGEADTFGPQELSLRMKKESGKWLISRVETMKTLR